MWDENLLLHWGLSLTSGSETLNPLWPIKRLYTPRMEYLLLQCMRAFEFLWITCFCKEPPLSCTSLQLLRPRIHGSWFVITLNHKCNNFQSVRHLNRILCSLITLHSLRYIILHYRVSVNGKFVELSEGKMENSKDIIVKHWDYAHVLRNKDSFKNVEKIPIWNCQRLILRLLPPLDVVLPDESEPKSAMLHSKPLCGLLFWYIIKDKLYSKTR